MKIVDKLKTQKETLAMAKYFAEESETKPTFMETILSVISATLIYGIGIAFGVYLIFGFLTQ
jgi:membrane-bound ClpP family serine protease